MSRKLHGAGAGAIVGVACIAVGVGVTAGVAFDAGRCSCRRTRRWGEADAFSDVVRSSRHRRRRCRVRILTGEAECGSLARTEIAQPRSERIVGRRSSSEVSRRRECMRGRTGSSRLHRQGSANAGSYDFQRSDRPRKSRLLGLPDERAPASRGPGRRRVPHGRCEGVKDDGMKRPEIT